MNTNSPFCQICGNEIPNPDTEDLIVITQLKEKTSTGRNPSTLLYHTSCFEEMAGEDYIPEYHAQTQNDLKQQSVGEWLDYIENKLAKEIEVVLPLSFGSTTKRIEDAVYTLVHSIAPKNLNYKITKVEAYLRSYNYNIFKVDIEIEIESSTTHKSTISATHQGS